MKIHYSKKEIFLTETDEIEYQINTIYDWHSPVDVIRWHSATDKRQPHIETI